MPRKPLKPCRYPGCPKLTDGRYCEEHQKLVDSQYNKYERDKVSQKFYQSAEWKAVRKLKLQLNPLCEECERNGKLVKAYQVHHAISIKNGGQLLDINNLRSLCLSCHSKIHLKERNYGK